VPSELIRANLATHPTKWARARPFHDVKVWKEDSMFLENKNVQQRFWSLLQAYDHHQEIMPYNGVKKMT
jgi:hypothetical protein